MAADLLAQIRLAGSGMTLEGCVVLTGTCADEDGNAVSFRRYLDLEASGLILHD